MISLIKMKFEMDSGSAFMVSFVMAEHCSVAKIRCLSSSSATFFSEIKHEGRLVLFSAFTDRQYSGEKLIGV